MKESIKALSKNQLKDYLLSEGEASYRTQQILEWLYSQRVDNFDLMTNLPKSLIEKLSRDFVIGKLSLVERSKSSDGTIKYILESNVSEKVKFEAVAIPSSNGSNSRLTVCISSQAGCPMGCEFCATGKQGFTRNLNVGEIVDQVLIIEDDFKKRVSNVVVMGQGEPFLNYETVIGALEIINDDKLIGIGARKITVSTCGILEGIRKFSSVNKQYGLAISLHSAVQNKRNELMPGVKNFKLDKLHDEINNYISLTNRRPTLEYLMLDKVNDTDEDLEALISFTKDLHCHVNLINYNSTEGSKFKGSTKSTINKWIEILENNGTETTLRYSKGSDIDAACGQLLNKSLK